MLSHQISWRIKNLLSQLTEQNIKDSIQEINALLKMNGDDNRTVILSSLLDDLDFHDPRSIQSQQPKVRWLIKIDTD